MPLSDEDLYKGFREENVERIKQRPASDTAIEPSRQRSNGSRGCPQRAGML